MRLFNKINNFMLCLVPKKYSRKAAKKFIDNCLIWFWAVAAAAIILCLILKAKIDDDLIFPLFGNAILLLGGLAVWVGFRHFYVYMKDHPEEDEHKAELPYVYKNNLHGMVLGKKLDNGVWHYAISSENETYMTLVLGTPGSGKTSAFVIPSLKSWRGNFFAIDIAGDIARNTITYRENAKLIKIGMDSFEDSASYDIMYPIDNAATEDERVEQVEILAQQLLPDIPNASQESKFFNAEGRNLLISALLFYIESDMDFVEICDAIVSKSCEQLITAIMKHGSRIAKEYISGFVGNKSETNSACKGDCDKAIRIFTTNSMLRHVLHRPKDGQESVNCESLEYGDVYVQVPEHKLDVYKDVISIIVSQNISCLSWRSGNTPVLMMIDEFARLNKMDEVKSALMTIRKHNVRIALCIQSFASLEALYGREGAQEIVDCCYLKLIMQVNNQKTQEELSRMLGEKYVNVRSYRRTLDSTEGYITKREKQRNVRPEELGYLKDELIVVHPTGYERLNKAYYFEDE